MAAAECVRASVRVSSDDISQAAEGGPFAVAMGERRRAVLAYSRQQAPEATDRDAREPGRGRHRETPLDDLDHDMGPLLLPLAQACPGMAESLIFWG